MQKNKSKIKALFLGLLLAIAMVLPMSVMGSNVPSPPPSVQPQQMEQNMQSENVPVAAFGFEPLGVTSPAALRVMFSHQYSAFLPGEWLQFSVFAECENGWWIGTPDSADIEWAVTGLVAGDYFRHPAGWTGTGRLLDLCQNTSTVRSITVTATWLPDPLISDSATIAVDPTAPNIRVGAPSAMLRSGQAGQITIPVFAHNIPNGSHAVNMQLLGVVTSSGDLIWPTALNPIEFNFITETAGQALYSGILDISNGRATLTIAYNGTTGLNVGEMYNLTFSLYMDLPQQGESISTYSGRIPIAGPQAEIVRGQASGRLQSGTPGIVTFPITTNLPNGIYGIYVHFQGADFLTVEGSAFQDSVGWHHGTINITDGNGTLTVSYNGTSQFAGNNNWFSFQLGLWSQAFWIACPHTRGIYIDGAPQILTTIDMLLRPDRPALPGDSIRVHAVMLDQFGNMIELSDIRHLTFTTQGLIGNDLYYIIHSGFAGNSWIEIDLDPAITTARTITVTASPTYSGDAGVTESLVISVDPTTPAIRFGEPATVELGTPSQVTAVVNAFNIPDGTYNAILAIPGDGAVSPAGFTFQGGQWPRIYHGVVTIANGTGTLTLNYGGFSEWTNFELTLSLPGGISVSDERWLNITLPIPPAGTSVTPPAGASRTPFISTSISGTWGHQNDLTLLQGSGLFVIIQRGNPNAIIINANGTTIVVDIATISGFPAGTMYPIPGANEWESFVPLAFLSELFGTYFRVEGNIVVIQHWTEELRLQAGISVSLWGGGHYIQNPIIWWPRPVAPPDNGTTRPPIMQPQPPTPPQLSTTPQPTSPPYIPWSPRPPREISTPDPILYDAADSDTISTPPPPPALSLVPPPPQTNDIRLQEGVSFGGVTEPLIWQMVGANRVGMVSMRAFAVLIGADPDTDIIWHSDTRTAEVRGRHRNGGTVTISVQMGSTDAVIVTSNAAPITIDIATAVNFLSGPAGTVEPLNIDGVVYLPLRFMAETFGFTVERDGYVVIFR